jgi:hypothetical protein
MIGAVLALAGCAGWGDDPGAAFSPVRVMAMGRGQQVITCVDAAAYGKPTRSAVTIMM